MVLHERRDAGDRLRARRRVAEHRPYARRLPVERVGVEVVDERQHAQIGAAQLDEVEHLLAAGRVVLDQVAVLVAKVEPFGQEHVDTADVLLERGEARVVPVDEERVEVCRARRWGRHTNSGRGPQPLVPQLELRGLELPLAEFRRPLGSWRQQSMLRQRCDRGQPKTRQRGVHQHGADDGDEGQGGEDADRAAKAREPQPAALVRIVKNWRGHPPGIEPTRQTAAFSVAAARRAEQAAALLQVGHHGRGDRIRQLAKHRGDHAIAADAQVERRREQFGDVDVERAGDAFERVGAAVPAFDDVEDRAAVDAGQPRQLLLGHPALSEHRANRVAPDRHGWNYNRVRLQGLQ